MCFILECIQVEALKATQDKILKQKELVNALSSLLMAI